MTCIIFLVSCEATLHHLSWYVPPSRRIVFLGDCGVMQHITLLDGLRRYATSHFFMRCGIPQGQLVG